ncbi:MAG: hypothetical protein ABW208_05390 [Pyrinomonadaceae bacterium]
MSWDKVNNPPVGPRGGPADTPSTVGPPANSPGPGETQEGPPGNAYGLRGRGNGREQHPRVQDVLNEGKQTLERLLGRTGETNNGRGRGDEHVPPGQAKKLQDGGRPDGRDNGQTRVPSNEGDGRGRSHESQGRSHESQGRPQESRGHEHSDNGTRTHGRGRGDDDHGRDNFRLPSNNNHGHGNNGFEGSHGRGHLDARGIGADALDNLNVASVVAYLRGDAGRGSHLPGELRQALDGASRVLGSDLVAALERRGPSNSGEQAVRFVEHALARIARTLGRVAETGGAAATNVPPRVGEAVGELLAATLLDKYFRKAEDAGGRVVAEARAALARLLYGDGGNGDGRRPATGGFDVPRRPDVPAPHPLEVLRDLQAGAFRPPDVGHSPFPLTGRALVATEMMELLRTLDAVERMTRELLATIRGTTAGAAPGALAVGDGDEAPLLALLRALSGTTAGAETLDELLTLLQPTLPGRAARLEIPRLVAALGGVLVDADGRALVTKDGVPLKLEQLLWLGSLGGGNGGVLNSLAGAESFPVRLSPLLIYGFDAVYSLIGFDGRTLNPPHFAAVQAQVNGSELEWVFGQPPLSEGWMRALIERLKDSAQGEHNLLGEMLEEALAEGRFHAALVGGTVSEGEAVADTFAVTRLLPGATACATA